MRLLNNFEKSAENLTLFENKTFAYRTFFDIRTVICQKKGSKLSNKKKALKRTELLAKKNLFPIRFLPWCSLRSWDWRTGSAMLMMFSIGYENRLLANRRFWCWWRTIWWLLRFWSADEIFVDFFSFNSFLEVCFILLWIVEGCETEAEGVVALESGCCKGCACGIIIAVEESYFCW